MNIRHLRIFIMVADCGKMSVAAEKLFITQPSVSQAIREIEDFYGIKLFERLSKKLYITESGALLLKYARHIVQSFDEMEMELKNTGQSISLRVGATITVGTCMLNKIIDDFEKSNKDIATKITINNTNVIERMILNSELDIGIVEGVIENKDIIKVPIYKDKLVIVVGKKHRFYNRKEINIEDLQGEDMIVREAGSGSRDTFQKILKERNIDITMKWISTNTEAIKNGVIGGHGISVLPMMIAEKEIEGGMLHTVGLKDIEIFRDICVVYHKNKFMSDHFKKFRKSIYSSYNVQTFSE